LSLYYLGHSFGHYIVSALHTASVCHCIVSVLLTAFVWSLYCLSSTYGFPLIMVLSLYYLRLSFVHCIVSVLLRALACSFYFFVLLTLLFVHCIVFVLHTLSLGHCVFSLLLTAIVWSLYCFCTTYGSRLVIILSLYYLRL
jgi:hypothetical protein